MISNSYFERFETPKYRAKNPLQRFLIKRFVARLHELFHAASGVGSVLEVGVGEGFVSGWLSEHHAEISFTGVDVRDEDLNRLKAKFPRIQTRRSSIYDVGTIDGKYDLVICAEVLEHLDDPARAISALAALRPKYLLITVPHEPWFRMSNFLRGKNLGRLGNDPEHVQQFGKRSLRRLLERQSEILCLRTSYPWLLALAKPS